MAKKKGRKHRMTFDQEYTIGMLQRHKTLVLYPNKLYGCRGLIFEDGFPIKDYEFAHPMVIRSLLKKNIAKMIIPGVRPGTPKEVVLVHADFDPIAYMAGNLNKRWYPKV